MIDFSKIENADLHAMCLRGDETAWGYIYNYVLCVARDPHWQMAAPNAPEDIAQDVVCRLLTKGIDRVDNTAAFRGFVRRVTVNLILDTLKKRRVPTSSIENSRADEEKMSYDPPSTAPGPEELLEHATLLEDLGKAIGGLPDKCSSVLNSYIEYKMGLFGSLSALAEAVGIGVKTLSSRVKRCLDQLRFEDKISVWLEG